MARTRFDMGGLRPIDDLMFRVTARSEAFCGEALRVLLGDPGLEVVKNTPAVPRQEYPRPLGGA